MTASFSASGAALTATTSSMQRESDKTGVAKSIEANPGLARYMLRTKRRRQSYQHRWFPRLYTSPTIWELPCTMVILTWGSIMLFTIEAPKGCLLHITLTCILRRPPPGTGAFTKFCYRIFACMDFWGKTKHGQNMGCCAKLWAFVKLSWSQFMKTRD